VAQSGSALALGARCRRFESCLPDQFLKLLFFSGFPQEHRDTFLDTATGFATACAATKADAHRMTHIRAWLIVKVSPLWSVGGFGSALLYKLPFCHRPHA
jgi:hypothetical protein